jgi:alkylated DNA repair dioxygenase AlkB
MDLFNQITYTDHLSEASTTIPGLRAIENFIDAREEGELLAWIDGEPWRNDLKRRVQHYGYRYDYRAHRAFAADYLGPLPPVLANLRNRIAAALELDEELIQAIVNEYEPGQGIAAHIDCEPCFGPTICSLSLGSDVVMDWQRGALSFPLFVKRRALLAFSGEARSEWTHGIKGRKSDLHVLGAIARQRRLSVTFRSMKF